MTFFVNIVEDGKVGSTLESHHGSMTIFTLCSVIMCVLFPACFFYSRRRAEKFEEQIGTEKSEERKRGKT